MKELKITKERLRAMAKKCPEAEGILREGFPEAFKEEDEWEDITLQIAWKPSGAGKNYWLQGYYGNKQIAHWYASDGIKDNKHSGFKLEITSNVFRILKKR